MRGQMRRLLVAFGLFGIVILASPFALQADGSFSGSGAEDMPLCINMPEAQIPGHRQGAACRVPVRSVAGEGTFAPMLTLYRSGRTDRTTSESDSDIAEDYINVEGYLYWYDSSMVRHYWDDCDKPEQYSTHTVCTNTSGGGGTWEQDGDHYFRTAGYVDDHFETRDRWTQ